MLQPTTERVALLQPTTERVALLLPTSLCSSEVARTLAAEMQRDLGGPSGVRFLALAHTEGCGVSDERTSASVLLGHLASPLVAQCLLLEHGCEKTHNDYFSNVLHAHGLDARQFGFASLQNDGGVSAVRAKVKAWFAQRVPPAPPPRAAASLATLGVALLAGHSASGEPPAAAAASLSLPDGVAVCFARLAGLIAQRGLLVMPQSSALLRHPQFLETALAEPPRPTLAYGQSVRCPPLVGTAAGTKTTGGEVAPSAAGPSGESVAHAPPSPAVGFHVMQMPTSRWVEIVTGIGASGVHLMLAWRARDAPSPTGHPMIPMLTLALAEPGVPPSSPAAHAAAAAEPPSFADVLLPPGGQPSEWCGLVLDRMAQLASGAYTPLAMAHGNVDFQIARGTAVSL